MLFRVTKKDLTICEYPVKGLQRKRLDTEHDQDNLLHNQFHKAISATMSSLDSEDGPVDKEGSDEPVDQEESWQVPVGRSKKGMSKIMYMLQHGVREVVGQGYYYARTVCAEY